MTDDRDSNWTDLSENKCCGELQRDWNLHFNPQVSDIGCDQPFKSAPFQAIASAA
jgi:hypothetical protein